MPHVEFSDQYREHMRTTWERFYDNPNDDTSETVAEPQQEVEPTQQQPSQPLRAVDPFRARDKKVEERKNFYSLARPDFMAQNTDLDANDYAYAYNKMLRKGRSDEIF